jgi:predicted GNAT family acetyltransferase
MHHFWAVTASVLIFLSNTAIAIIVPSAMKSGCGPNSDIFHPKHIIKELSSCGLDSDKAFKVLLKRQPFLAQPNISYAGSYDSKPILHLIGILSKTNDIDRAYELLSRVIQSHDTSTPTSYVLQTYKGIIGMLGTKKQYEKIMEYVYNDIPFYTKMPPPIDIYHVAISALGRGKKIRLVTKLIQDMRKNKDIKMLCKDGSSLEYKFPTPDRMAYLTALTASTRNKASDISVMLLSNMSEQGIKPDRIAYTQVLASLAQCPSKFRCDQSFKIWQDMENNNESSDASYKSLLNIFTKEKKWDDVALVRQRIHSEKMLIDETSGFLLDLDKLEKVQGNKVWYKLGHVEYGNEIGSDLIFGIQNHRNPTDNGVSLVFYEATGTKIGYMLIRNQLNQQILFSDIIGMYIQEEHRGRGIAKVCIAIWLQLCLICRAFPRSEKINKPLLSLILSKFGFKPNDGGVDIEISPISNTKVDLTKLNWRPNFAIYSKSISPNDGTFGDRELVTQRMVVVNTPPYPRGKLATVKTSLYHPSAKLASQCAKTEHETLELQNQINKVLQHKIQLYVEDIVLSNVLFGYLLPQKGHQQIRKRKFEAQTSASSHLSSRSKRRIENY